MELFSVLFIIIGLAAGYAIGYFQSRSQLSRLEERNRNLDEQLEALHREMKEHEHRANEAEKQLAERNADFRNLRQKLDEQKEEMESLQDRFKDEFENLANRILEEKSKKFTEQNREKLDQLLKPLSEKMEDFKKKVEETHKEDIEGRSALREHLEHLKEMNKQLEKEARDLTKALKGESKTQGRWGEVILQRILEKSGLTEGREYETQVGVKTAEGGQQYLDVVVHLPDEKNIIIDSKVSLKAYERYISAEDEQEREQALRQHVQSLRNHVKGLGSKNYQQQLGERSPDFVLLFIPIESAFGIALQKDSDLYYEAFEKNIVIVSPSTLLATLATIDSVWKQEYQNKNAMEIAERGGALYDKFKLFVESMQDIGQRIRQTQESYDQAMNRLSTGQGNVIRQVEMLKELGAKASKQLPGELTDPAPAIEQEEKESGSGDGDQ